MALRRGPRLLADELFLMAHGHVSGRPRLHPRVGGLGLAAGLVGELVLFGNVSVVSGALVVIDRAPPADALAHRVLDHLIGEGQPLSLRDWLAFLAGDATQDVAGRLERANLVSRVESRRPWRHDPRWVPVDLTRALGPALRVRWYAARGQLGVPDAVLAGLALACGLEAHLLSWDTPPAVRRYLDHAVSRLPGPLHELVATTAAAVGNAVLNHRT